MSSDTVGWRMVENRSDIVTGNYSPQILPRSVRKIRRRTKILNRELKKFSALTSYARYVEIKTRILRNVSEDESSEDNGSDHRELDSEDSEYTARNNVDVENADYSEEDSRIEMPSPAERNSISPLDQRNRSSIETETSVEEASDKSIPDCSSIPAGDSGIDRDSPERSDDATVDGCCTDAASLVPTATNRTVIEERTEASEKTEEEIVEGKIVDERAKKCHPIITHTEIVESKYTIIRDENAHTVEESMGPEEGMKSQSVLSDSTGDEFELSRDDDPRAAEIPDHRQLKTQYLSKKNLRSEPSAINSINDRIKEQGIRHSSLGVEKEQRVSTGIPFEAESLRQVLTNLSRERCRNEEVERVLRADGAQQCKNISHEKQHFIRPYELRDFVASEGLTPACQLSTITMKDISTSIEEDEKDEKDVWLMEIPRSIITDPELCGKRMVIDKWNVTIGDTTYVTIPRQDVSLSCVLRSKRKAARYETVNIRPVCSIKVGQQSAPERESGDFAIAIGKSPESPKSVPFPKNVKSRNPLMDDDKVGTLPLKEIRTKWGEQNRKRPQKLNNRRKPGFWTIDRFIIKSRKKK